jgi:V/A-type H+/Na+-transporting ATPase subunit E
MDNKLQELTEKLYNEGVAKGNQEAEKILATAQAEASNLVKQAKQEAQAIVEAAQKSAEELTKNTRTELQMASKQAISALSQEVTSLINGSIASASVKQATTDASFMQNLILSAVQNWATKQDLLVVVPEKDKSAVIDFFTAKAKALLDNGLAIESANNVKAGFQIGPKDGSYKVSFTEADFINFFKEFLRPKLVELLFEQK